MKDKTNSALAHSTCCLQIPFELCEHPPHTALSTMDEVDAACVHVFTDLAFRVDPAFTSSQEILIHPSLQRIDKFVPVGCRVAIWGELSLLPWTGAADVRAVIRAPSSPRLAHCYLLNTGGARAISRVLEHKSLRHFARFRLLLAAAAALCVLAGISWRRQRSRARLLASVLQLQELRAPDESTTLRKCCVCRVKLCNSILLDCRHQVCCLECARLTFLPAPSLEPTGDLCRTQPPYQTETQLVEQARLEGTEGAVGVGGAVRGWGGAGAPEGEGEGGRREIAAGSRGEAGGAGGAISRVEQLLHRISGSSSSSSSRVVSMMSLASSSISSSSAFTPHPLHKAKCPQCGAPVSLVLRVHLS